MNRVELELIHRELDGENTPEDSRRLQALLAENRDAKNLYDELSTVDSGLRQADMVEPPPWLKRNVMDALPKRSEGFSVPAFLRDLWESMQARPALAYAYTFVIGILFGLGLFAVALQDTPADQGDLYGALVDEDTSGPEVLPIQLPGFEGKAEVLTSERLFVVDLTVVAHEKVEVRLIPVPSLPIRGFTRKTDNADTSIEIESDSILFDVVGSDRYAVMFNREGSNVSHVRLEVRRDGRLIYEEQLRAGAS